MFCMHCGKPTEGDQLVCPQCAAQQAAQQAPQAPVEPAPQPAAQPVYEQPVAPAPQPVYEQPAPQQPVFEQPVYQQPAPQQPVWQEAPQQPVYQQPVYQQPAPQQDTFVLNTPETAGKKKKKNKLLTAIIALVTAAAVVVGGIVGWPYISNWFNKTTSTPQEYSSSTLTNTLADENGALITTYSQLRNLLNSNIDPTNMAVDATMRLQINESMLKNMLSTALQGADLGIDADDLAFLSDISVKMNYNAKDNGFEITATPVLGSTEIVTLEAGVDLDAGKFWFRLPELSDEYVTGEFDPSDLDIDMDEMEQSMAMVQQVAQILPEEEVIVRLLEKYIPLALKQIDDVSEEETTLRTGELEQKVTQTTSKIDEEATLKMAIACLKEVQKDKDIAAILDDLGAYMGAGSNASEQILSQLPEVIEGLEEQLEEVEESESTIDLITYADAKGNAVGLAVEMNGTTFVNMFTLRDGDKFASAISCPEGEIELTAEGTDKKGIVNATYVLDYQGMELVELTLKDFDTKTMSKGTLVITPGDELFELVAGGNSGVSVIASMGLSLEMSFETGKTEATTSIALLSKGQELFQLTLDSKTKSPTSVNAPSGGIDIEDDAAGMQWITEWNYEAVLNNLRKGGVPGELVDMLEQALEQGLSQTATDTLAPENEAAVGSGALEESIGTGTALN